MHDINHEYSQLQPIPRLENLYYLIEQVLHQRNRLAIRTLSFTNGLSFGTFAFLTSNEENWIEIAAVLFFMCVAHTIAMKMFTTSRPVLVQFAGVQLFMSLIIGFQALVNDNSTIFISFLIATIIALMFVVSLGHSFVESAFEMDFEDVYLYAKKHQIDCPMFQEMERRLKIKNGIKSQAGYHAWRKTLPPLGVYFNRLTIESIVKMKEITNSVDNNVFSKDLIRQVQDIHSTEQYSEQLEENFYKEFDKLAQTKQK